MEMNLFFHLSCLDVKFGGTVESKIHLFINQKLNVHKGI